MPNKTKNNTLISWFLTGLSFFSAGTASANSAPDTAKPAAETTFVNYNASCNGSLAWLSSTTETRDSKNSAARISPDKKYYGINQLNGYNVSRLIKFINTNDKYKKLRGHLSYTTKKEKNKNGKMELKYIVDGAKWKNLAQTQNALFTAAQEDFICEIYLPECFQKLQKSLINKALKNHQSPIAVSSLNPVVLSLFARRYIKSPNSKAPFEAIKNKNIIEINSENFIKNFCGSNEYLKNKALSAFNKKDLIWNEHQITKACSLAQKEYTQYQTKHQTHLTMVPQKSVENRIADCRKREGLTTNTTKSNANVSRFLSAARNKRQMG